MTDLRSQRSGVSKKRTEDKRLSGMNLKGAEILELSFLEKLAEERKTKQR